MPDITAGNSHHRRTAAPEESKYQQTWQKKTECYQEEQYKLDYDQKQDQVQTRRRRRRHRRRGVEAGS